MTFWARLWMTSVTIVAMLQGRAEANKADVLYGFAAGNDGGLPTGALVYHSGVLFGTTVAGGGTGCQGHGCGTVFTYDIKSKTEKVLYSFAGGSDGALPAAGLTYLDGFVYGTTSAGGGGTQCGSTGCGTLFKVDVTSGVESQLYVFQNGKDGSLPHGPLLYFGGVFFGTLLEGASGSSGAVFEYNPKSGQETSIYTFTGGTDGGRPIGPVVNVSGIIYGTAIVGGTGQGGVVFAINPKTLTEAVVHAFPERMDSALTASAMRMARFMEQQPTAAPLMPRSHLVTEQFLGMISMPYRFRFSMTS